MSYQARAEYDLNHNGVRVFLVDRHRTGSVAEIVFDPQYATRREVEPGQQIEPLFTLDVDAARAVYEALGVQLSGIRHGDHLAQLLEKEQQRVDKMLDHLIAGSS